MNDDSQKTWADFYLKKKDQRLSEAALMWKELHKVGVTNETVLALDFLHFGSSQEGIESLAKQLSENYEIKVVPGNEPGYWFAQGTTRPYGITLDEEQHLNWVSFMADVAQSHGCVFSSWALEAPSIGVKFNSEDIESDS
ncbi:MAG: hypothetical protein B0A82_01600 [Alkalinema sp. CACIAM 70d]|nr:MAG: hypothetical protein B0A82_01600 [Alkalinema sp. CACIAM 70d]